MKVSPYLTQALQSLRNTAGPWGLLLLPHKVMMGIDAPTTQGNDEYSYHVN